MDLATLTQAIGLATTAVGATGKAAETINSIKGLFEGNKDPDTAEATRLLNTLAGELTAANLMNVQISEALRFLNQQIQQENAFEAEKAKYELYHTAQDDVVFKLRGDDLSDRPPHYICPVCLNRDKIFSYITGSGDFKTCQADKNHCFEFSYTENERSGVVYV